MSRDELEWLEIKDFSLGIVGTEDGIQGHAPLGSAYDAYGCLSSRGGALIPGWSIVEYSSGITPPNNNWTSGYRPSTGYAAPGKQVLCDTAIWSPAVHVNTSPNPDHLPDMDRPDHLFTTYSEYYDAGNASAYTKWNHFLGYALALEDTTGAYTPLVYPNESWNTTYNANLEYFSEFASQIASGRSQVYNTGGVWGTLPGGFTYGPTIHPVVTQGGHEQNQFQTFPDLNTGLWSGTWPVFNDSVTWDSNDFTRWCGAMTYHQNRLVWAHQDFGLTTPNMYIPTSGASVTNYGILGWTPHLYYTAVLKGAFYDKDIGGLNNTITSGGLSFGEANEHVLWMHSVNANTLMVMTQIGAYLIRGDLDRPQVSRLAGVPGCFHPYTAPAAMQGAIVYGTKEGIYQLSESGQAKCMSTNLPGDFWISDEFGDGVYRYDTYSGRLTYRDPWLMAPNNYVCDTENNSWWRLPYSPTVGELTYNQYQVSANGKVYAFPWYRSNTQTTTWVRYDPTTQLSGDNYQWSWTSNPIPDLMIGQRGVIIRELEIVFSGHGSLDVEFLDEAGDVIGSTTFGVSSGRPRRHRADFNINTNAARDYTDSVQVRMTATGNSASPLPSVYSIRVGHRTGTTIGAT